jgi:glutathione S-transferase
LEEELKETTKDGLFCYGNTITMADIVLVPQVSFSSFISECDVEKMIFLMCCFVGCECVSFWS